MNKLSPLHETHQKFLNAIPNEFTNKEAELICESIGLRKRWFATSLRKKTFYALFSRPNHGRYRKK